tara:strand:+ start:36 stop:740 length:705 start_codon:yes stop_codon:yes gene_type:complete
MKKSELRKIIKESINELMNEQSVKVSRGKGVRDIQTGEFRDPTPQEKQMIDNAFGRSDKKLKEQNVVGVNPNARHIFGCDCDKNGFIIQYPGGGGMHFCDPGPDPTNPYAITSNYYEVYNGEVNGGVPQTGDIIWVPQFNRSIKVVGTMPAGVGNLLNLANCACPGNSGCIPPPIAPPSNPTDNIALRTPTQGSNNPCAEFSRFTRAEQSDICEECLTQPQGQFCECCEDTMIR